MTRAVEKRRKEKSMTEIPDDVPESKREDYERGVALLINVTHDRDEAIANCQKAMTECDRLRADLAARDATIGALKDMLSFSEQQAKIRDAENATRISSYQLERDTAIRELAEADARLDLLAESVLGQIKNRAVKTVDQEQMAKGNGSGREVIVELK
jgi:hypothetical protein